MLEGSASFVDMSCDATRAVDDATKEKKEKKKKKTVGGFTAVDNVSLFSLEIAA